MGDILRRNDINLGLHVVQCPEEVTDAQDGDEMTFDTGTRVLISLTRKKTYEVHRVDADAAVSRDRTVRVYCDLLPGSDGTAPFTIHTFNQITGGNTLFPRQIAIASRSTRRSSGPVPTARTTTCSARRSSCAPPTPPGTAASQEGSSS